MSSVRTGDTEVEMMSFEEFARAKDSYPELKAKSAGDGCFKIYFGDGYVYFSKNEVLVRTKQGKWLTCLKKDLDTLIKTENK